MKFKPTLKTTINSALFTALIASTCIGGAPQAYAAKLPKDGVVDARIKTLPYRENEVFRLTGHYGFSTVLEFASGENIETISIGDSESWQLVKPKRGNLLLIKPLEENAQTNMTVVTDQRIYTFEMNAYISEISPLKRPFLPYQIQLSGVKRFIAIRHASCPQTKGQGKEGRCGTNIIGSAQL